MQNTKTKSKVNSKTVYEALTDKIVSQLENGEIPWRKSWKTTHIGANMNMITKRKYKGINFFVTMFEDRITPVWLTFKQAKKLGGNIIKGEHGIPIVYFQFFERTDIEGKSKLVPLIKRSTVFNLEQIEGIENPYLKEIEDVANAPLPDPIEACEALLTKITSKLPLIKEKLSNRAYFSPSEDMIVVPDKRQFDSMEDYYSTLFHEISHSTGMEKRLNRKGIANCQTKGSNGYALEELVAELSSSFLCSYCGIISSTEQNTTAYIQSWLSHLRNDVTLVYNAMKEAFKVLEYLEIIDISNESEDEEL